MRAGELHEVFGVALVHDREVGRDAGGRAEFPEETMPGAVKGAAGHVAAGAPDQTLGAGEHFLGGATREGEEEYAFGGDPCIYKMRDSIDQGTRFPRSRPRDNEQGSLAEGGGRRLLGIQLQREVAGRGWDIRRSGIDARVGHAPKMWPSGE